MSSKRVTQAQIAAHIDLSLTKTREYIRSGVIRKGATLDEARVAYIRHLRAEKGGVTQERARLDAARADLAELDAKERRGELVPAGDSDLAMIALATITSGAMQGISTRIAPGLAADTTRAGCKAIVDEAIEAALEDLSEEARRAAARM